MDRSAALEALSALAQETRLDAFRLLVRAGPPGLPAGRIAELLGVRQNTLSTNLGILVRAGLVWNEREGRSIRYVADLDGMSRLLGFLLEDCCGGRPETCQPLLAELANNLSWRHAMSDKQYKVLFLCTGNSARSIMAEAILNRLGTGKFRAYSAGSMPKGEVHPFALDILRVMNHKTDGLRSKSWDEFAGEEAQSLDFVFTLCDSAATEVCPVWPGQPMTAHWGLPDPAAVEGSDSVRRAAFAEAYKVLHTRLDIFTNLPMASLDKLGLQERLEKIGKAEATSTAA